MGFDLVIASSMAEPTILLADRGYVSDNVLSTMAARNVVSVIPMRKASKLGVSVDSKLNLLRNLVKGASIK